MNGFHARGFYIGMIGMMYWGVGLITDTLHLVVLGFIAILVGYALIVLGSK